MPQIKEEDGTVITDIHRAAEVAGIELASRCHICEDVIDYCQGHAGETCACICSEGCLCGDCGFDDREAKQLQEDFEFSNYNLDVEIDEDEEEESV